MIRLKSKSNKSNNIEYDQSEEPIVISKHTIDILLKTEHPPQCMALYQFLYYTAKWQKTNQPKATAKYIGKALKWSERYVRKIKAILIDVGLIENIKRVDPKTGKIKGWYTKINFIWKKTTLSKKNTVGKTTRNKFHPVDKKQTNALSTNKRKDALKTNKKEIKKKESKPLNPLNGSKGNNVNKGKNGNTPPIKLFKEYLPKEYLRNKELIPSIKDFIEHRIEIKVPLTQRAIKIMCNQCKKFTPKETQQAFENAVACNYRGIFPKKQFEYSGNGGYGGYGVRKEPPMSKDGSIKSNPKMIGGTGYFPGKYDKIEDNMEVIN